MDASEREQDIMHHVAVLMHHDAGEPEFAATARRFAELCAELVPERGEAESAQGEVLRAIDRLASEDRRNGNANWGDFYESFVRFLSDVLAKEPSFRTGQRTRIGLDLDLIARNGRDDSDVDPDDVRIAFGRLIVDAVAFCRARPHALPRDELRRQLTDVKPRKPWWRLWAR